ncbi:hypothetical protein Avbf_00022 [Armadillidium vulgare]|nr:hypothetical protein Avbf_00022 [Armadillidium vulgare]
MISLFVNASQTLVPQAYIVDVSLSNVIKGNSALLKCNIPSFVADFVQVSSWVTDKGHTFLPSDNYGLLKCEIPSFVADFVSVQSWVDSEGKVYYPSDENFVLDESVLKGNSALFKCVIPSFVADFVEVKSWVDHEGQIYMPSDRYDGKYLVLPSGELHIRSVTPEDGEKSYSCRTVHRLTGETRLSATAGRLVISVFTDRVY